jgi:uncharacterized protein
VVEVDVKRKRIGLSMRLDDEPGASTARGPRDDAPARKGGGKPREAAPPANNAMAAALAKLRR